MGLAKPPRTGTLARGAITGLVAARIGLARLGHRLRPPDQDAQAQTLAQAQHEAHIGRLLYQALSQLRGTALKVSQLLSMDATFLPAAMRLELARACHQVAPLNRALVGRVFRSNFGQEPETLFSSFDPIAFAAASLGQVHRAELAGYGPLAVKVQYPGIAATIASDMVLLRTALNSLRQSSFTLPDSTVIDRVLAEIEATLRREVDYLQEARALQWFGQHAAWPGVVIPQPVLSHTTAQVLTLQHLHGLHLPDWLQTQPSQSERNRFGQLLFDWFMHCAFELKHLHADFHPGNILFMAEGRLGILDFGCTRTLSNAFAHGVLQAWALVLASPSNARSSGLLKIYRRLGLVHVGLDELTFAQQLLPALAPMHAWQTQAFTRPVFDFSHKTPPPTPLAEHQRRVAQHMVGMPGEMPAFERAWMGLMHLLTRMGAQVSTASACLDEARYTRMALTLAAAHDRAG